jgi:hypothetical protein
LAIISSLVGIARFAKGKVGNAECNSAQKND